MFPIEIQHLRYAITVSDCGSFTAAAALLGIETSAVSRRIRDLEDYLGVGLFHRGPRGTTPTEAGAAYIGSVKSILEALGRAEKDARLAATGSTGRVKIGFVWSFSFGPVLSILQQFHRAAPQVVVELVEDGPDRLIRRLHERSLDVVLTAIEPKGHLPSRPIGRLHRLTLWSERLLAAVPSNETLEAVTWSDLSERELLCRSVDDAARFEDFIRSTGGPALRFVPQDCSREGLLGLIAAGLGWSVIPESLAQVSIAGVRHVPILDDTAEVQIEALWHATDGNPALRRFLSIARTAILRSPIQHAAAKPSNSRI